MLDKHIHNHFLNSKIPQSFGSLDLGEVGDVTFWLHFGRFSCVLRSTFIIAMCNLTKRHVMFIMFVQGTS
jgi:hypothetical protein